MTGLLNPTMLEFLVETALTLFSPWDCLPGSTFGLVQDKGLVGGY